MCPGPSPAHVSNPAAWAPSDPPAGAAPLGPATRRGRSSRASTWRRIWGWESPPMVPSTARSEPSGRVTSAGDSVCGGRRPGPSSAGWPGARRKPMPRSWRKIPVAGSTRWAPQPDGVRLDQRDAHALADRRRSTTVVPPRAAERAGGRPGRSGSMAARRRGQALGSSSAAAVGAVVEHRVAVDARAPGPPRPAGGPSAGSSGSSGSVAGRSATAAPASVQVALRRRRGRRARRGPTRSTPSGSTHSAWVRARSSGVNTPAAEREQPVAELARGRSPSGPRRRPPRGPRPRRAGGSACPAGSRPPAAMAGSR